MEKDTLFGFTFEPEEPEKASDEFDKLLDEYIGQEFDDVDEVEPKQVVHPRGIGEQIQLEHDFILARIKMLEKVYNVLKEKTKDLNSNIHIMSAKRIIDPIAKLGDVYQTQRKEPLIDPDHLKPIHRQILHSLEKTLGSDVAIQIEQLLNKIPYMSEENAIATLKALQTALEQATQILSDAVNPDEQADKVEEPKEQQISEPINPTEDNTDTQEDEEQEQADSRELPEFEEEEKEEEESIEDEQPQTGEDEEQTDEQIEQVAKTSPFDAVINAIEEEMEETEPETDEPLDALITDEEDEMLEEEAEDQKGIDAPEQESIWDEIPALRKVKGVTNETATTATAQEATDNLEQELEKRIIETQSQTSAEQEHQTANQILKESILFVTSTSDIVSAASKPEQAIFVAAEDSPVYHLTVHYNDDKQEIAFEVSGTILLLTKHKDNIYTIDEEVAKDDAAYENTAQIVRAYVNTENDNQVVFELDNGTYVSVEYLKRGRYSIDINNNKPNLEAYTMQSDIIPVFAKLFKNANIPELEAFDSTDTINEALGEDKVMLDEID